MSSQSTAAAPESAYVARVAPVAASEREDARGVAGVVVDPRDARVATAEHDARQLGERRIGCGSDVRSDELRRAGRAHRGRARRRPPRRRRSAADDRRRARSRPRSRWRRPRRPERSRAAPSVASTSASTSRGTTSRQSPTMPTSAASNTSASGRSFTASDRTGGPHADHVVELPREAERDVEAGSDAPAGDPELAGAGEPPLVGHLAGGGELGAEHSRAADRARRTPRERHPGRRRRPRARRRARRGRRRGSGRAVGPARVGSAVRSPTTVARSRRGRSCGSIPARTVTSCGVAVAVDRGDERATERRLPRDETVTVDLERDGVAGESGAECSRGARRDLAAPHRSRARGPPTASASRAHSTSADRDVLLDVDAGDRDDLVGAPAAEPVGVGRRSLGGDGRDDRDHPTAERRRRAEQLAGEARRARPRRARRSSDRAHRPSGIGHRAEVDARRRARRRARRARRGSRPRGGPARRAARRGGGAAAARSRARAPGRRWSGSRPAPTVRRPRSRARRWRIAAAGTAARPSGSTLHGSMSRSAVERSAGRRTSAWSQPSSSSQRACTRPSGSIARWRTPVRNGRSSSSASSGGTWPVSASTELRPAITRSNGPVASIVAASARAVASVSEPANAASVTSTPSIATSRSSPHATASRTESSAAGGPSATTVTEPPCSSTSATAWATARRQYGFISSSSPSRTRRPSGPELHRLELRDLLDEGGDPEGWHRRDRNGRPPAPDRRRCRQAPCRTGRSVDDPAFDGVVDDRPGAVPQRRARRRRSARCVRATRSAVMPCSRHVAPPDATLRSSGWRRSSAAAKRAVVGGALLVLLPERRGTRVPGRRGAGRRSGRPRGARARASRRAPPRRRRRTRRRRRPRRCRGRAPWRSRGRGRRRRRACSDRTSASIARCHECSALFSRREASVTKLRRSTSLRRSISRRNASCASSRSALTSEAPRRGRAAASAASWSQ